MNRCLFAQKFILAVAAPVLTAKPVQPSCCILLTGDPDVRFTVNTQPIQDVLPDGFVIRNRISQGRDDGFVRGSSAGELIVLSTSLNLAGSQLPNGSFTSPILVTGNCTLMGFNDLRGPLLRMLRRLKPWCLSRRHGC